MNKHLLPIGIIIIFSCSKPINEKSLVERNELLSSNSDKPFSGKFFSVTKIDKKEKRFIQRRGINGNYTEWFSNGQKNFLSNIKIKKYYIDQTGTGMVPFHKLSKLLGKGKWLYKKGDEAPYNGGVLYIHSNGVRVRRG